MLDILCIFMSAYNTYTNTPNWGDKTCSVYILTGLGINIRNLLIYVRNLTIKNYRVYII